MYIEFRSEDEVLRDPDICMGCERVCRAAQEEGYINVLTYVSDAGSLIAFDDDEDVIGYMSLSTWCTPDLSDWWEGNETIYIEQVAVAPECRGMGVARSLYDELDNLGYAQELCSVHRTNDISRSMHEAFGFIEVGEYDSYIVFSKTM